MKIKGKQKFRAEGAIVFCEPQRTMVDGVVGMTMGFKACTTSSEENAKVIADALNAKAPSEHIKALVAIIEKNFEVPKMKAEDRKVVNAAKKWLGQ